MKLENLIDNIIKETLNENGLGNLNKKQEVISSSKPDNNMNINESYVAQAGKFNLSTELLSDKTKKQHQELLEGYVRELNDISNKLDTADKLAANLNNSVYRSLKIDETYNHNAAFLHGLYFENISDLSSTISVDSLPYMRLARDFGSFDKWQEDFVACCLSARNGWAMTVYNVQLKRYMNTVIDLHSSNVMIGIIPIIVMDCWEHAYFKDYLANRKPYSFGMMKELNWSKIEERIIKADKIARILG